MSPSRPRKGATRATDIPPDMLDALSHGEMQTATLAECMAIDQARLLRTVFPELSPMHWRPPMQPASSVSSSA